MINPLRAQRDFERGAHARCRAKRQRPADRVRALAHVAQALAGAVLGLLEADTVVAHEHEPLTAALLDLDPGVRRAGVLARIREALLDDPEHLDLLVGP